MSTKLIFGVALLAIICGPAVAQTMTFGQGQMVTVSPSGEIRMVAAPADAKMMRTMHRRSKVMAGGFVVWMDDQGRLRMSSGCGLAGC
jgi:hypothetical protein